jgi:hypothetical protein
MEENQNEKVIKTLTKAQLFRKQSQGVRTKMTEKELYQSNLDANKKYYENNRERLKVQKLAYYHANRDKILMRNKEARDRKKVEKLAQKEAEKEAQKLLSQ